MTRDEQREAAIDDYRLRFGEVKGHELDAVVFGFNRGYQAGSEGRGERDECLQSIRDYVMAYEPESGSQAERLRDDVYRILREFQVAP